MLDLIQLAGWVALLLWGLHMVQSGMQRSFGADLRRLLDMALRNRGRAFLSGIVVTAILQSSTAVGLMLSAFSARGLVELVPALAAMLGANIGTTVIVQLFSFDLAYVAPALILAGVLAFRRGNAGRFRDFGRVPIGLGLMILALYQLQQSVAPYADLPAVRQLLAVLGDVPVLALILSAAITWAAHSSVAIILLLMSLAGRGALPLDTALVMVLGANLGTAINPLIEASTASVPATQRLPAGNLLTRALGCVLFLPFIAVLGRWVLAIDPNPSRAVANFHTAFNLFMALLCFPALGLLAALLRRLLPDRAVPADRSQPVYLEKRSRMAPAVALAAAAREALRMADVLEEMLRGASEAFAETDRKKIAEIRRTDDVLDRLNNEIKAYLSALNEEELEEADRRRLWEILTFAGNLEQAGDVVDRDVMVLARKRLQRGMAFSADARNEIAEIIGRLEANLSAAAAVFLTEDSRAARDLAHEKEAFRALEARSTERHFARLRGGNSAAAESSAILMELFRDLKRVNAHLVAGAAYPVLEGQGQLLQNRLRPSS